MNIRLLQAQKERILLGREDPPFCVVRHQADKGKLQKITGKQLSCASLSKGEQ